MKLLVSIFTVCVCVLIWVVNLVNQIAIVSSYVGWILVNLNTSKQLSLLLILSRDFTRLKCFLKLIYHFVITRLPLSNKSFVIYIDPFSQSHQVGWCISGMLFITLFFTCFQICIRYILKLYRYICTIRKRVIGGVVIEIDLLSEIIHKGQIKSKILNVSNRQILYHRAPLKLI